MTPLAKILQEKNLTHGAIARMLGVNRQNVSRWASGQVRLPPNIATRISQLLGIEAGALVFGDERAMVQRPAPKLQPISVVGEVAAGLWQDVLIDGFEPYTVDIPVDSRFDAAHMFALKVKGNSINRRAPDGSLVVCLDIHAAPRAPRDGDWVVARRMRNGLAETTVKQYRVTDGRAELAPDSTDPQHQTALIVGAHDGDEVGVTAFVLEFVHAGTRF